MDRSSARPDLFLTHNNDSHHEGGRQVDGVTPSLYALDEICQSPTIHTVQVYERGDIITALALGAQGILRACPSFVYCSNARVLSRICARHLYSP